MQQCALFIGTLSLGRLGEGVGRENTVTKPCIGQCGLPQDLNLRIPKTLFNITEVESAESKDGNAPGINGPI